MTLYFQIIKLLVSLTLIDCHLVEYYLLKHSISRFSANRSVLNHESYFGFQKATTTAYWLYSFLVRITELPEQLKIYVLIFSSTCPVNATCSFSPEAIAYGFEKYSMTKQNFGK